MKRQQSSRDTATAQKSPKQPLEPHKLQEQPAEGDRATIERELRRQPDNDKRK